MLFRQIKLVWYLKVAIKIIYKFKKKLMRFLQNNIVILNRKVTQSLYSKIYFFKITKNLCIMRNLKYKLKKKK